MKTLYICLFIHLLLISCQTKNNRPMQFTPALGVKDLCDYIPNFSQMSIEWKDAKFSLEGWIYVANDRIMLIDKYDVKIHLFDLKGNSLGYKLGRGRALNEFGGEWMTGFGFDDEGNFVAVEDLLYRVYDKNFYLKKMFLLERNIHDVTKSEVNGENVNAYTWIERRNCLRVKDSSLFQIMAFAKEDLLPDLDTRYLIANNIMNINIQEEVPNSVFARYPSIYQNNSGKLLAFNYTTFDIDKGGNFYVSYEADSLIYKFNRDLDQIETYGFKGRGMETDYSQYKNGNIHDFIDRERKEKGFYDWLEYIDEHNVLLRLYRKGGDQKTDGLQFYYKNNLVADVDIPKGYNYAGYCSNQIYLYKIDMNEEKVLIISTSIPTHN